jgi:ribonuclease HIII
MSKTNYVCKLTREQAEQLHGILATENWELDEAPHALWRARKDKTTAVAYESGKFCIQGKRTEEFVQFTLEPRVLEEVRMGYESVIAQAENPTMFTPHIGIDESGKGDFFGPLVIAAVYVDEQSAMELLEEGVQDSKNIKGDKRIVGLAGKIRQITKGNFAVVRIGPETYNQLYAKFANLNLLLGWGHARALEDVLEKVPDCPRAISDQFGRKATVKNALMELGKKVVLEQMPRAEADVAVAAASILARHGFVQQLAKLGEPYKKTLPKGASAKVSEIGVEIAKAHGMEELGKITKSHFRTTEKVRSLLG